MATVHGDIAPEDPKPIVDFGWMIRASSNATMAMMQARPERVAGGRPRIEK